MSSQEVVVPHVEAVARVLAPVEWDHINVFQRSLYRTLAHRLLTSTDPNVHEALLAALVRAGALKEERRCRCSCGGEFGAATHAFNAVHDASPTERRYVTYWEDVDE